MWELQHLTNLWASTACYKDTFTYFIYDTSSTSLAKLKGLFGMKIGFMSSDLKPSLISKAFVSLNVLNIIVSWDVTLRGFEIRSSVLDAATVVSLFYPEDRSSDFLENLLTYLLNCTV
jgi:hypothetical protein